MTRAELVNKLAFRMNATKKDAETYLTAFLDSIMGVLVQDGRVVIKDFGSFKVNEYKARTAKKPLTGELIELSAKRKPSFRAGKELRERVNEEMRLTQETKVAIGCLQVPENAFETTAG